MQAYAASRLTGSLLVPQVDYDAELSLADFTPGLAAWITRCAPFGIGNPEPVFLTRNLTLAAPIRFIQDKHVCLQLSQPCISSAKTAPPTIPALGWSRGPTHWPTLCATLAPGAAVDVLYRIRHNTGPYAGPHFNGLELELLAIEPASPARTRLESSSPATWVNRRNVHITSQSP